MLRRWKLLALALGMAVCITSVSIPGATLEDSMLKPSSEKSKTASSFTASAGSITEAADLLYLTRAERIQRIGEMCMADYQESGVLASVSAAQCILESACLTSELAENANNCFGMKTMLSGNDWEGSTWDGDSVYTKLTGEEYDGTEVTVEADFRQYDSIEESVADHSAYLLGAQSGDGSLRYEGLLGETDYKTAVQIIKDGGYATDSSYVEKVCNIIERYDLTQFDKISGTGKKTKNKKASSKTEATGDSLYRVRKSWEDAASQIGAFSSLENARAVCTEGYHIYNSEGKEIK